MSAYIVDDETISVLVKALEIYNVKYKADNYEEPKGWLIDLNEERNKIGQSLLDQNYKSVNYRYDEGTKSHKFEYKYVPILVDNKLNTGLILGCIQCYEYQACETEDYFESKIHYSLKRLKDAMLERYIKNDGYEIAWG